MSSGHFTIEDRDLDDAELWAVIDSAAASSSAARSRRIPLSIKNSSSPVPSPIQPKLFRSAKNFLAETVVESRVPRDGEVVQEERWTPARPQKMARFVEPASSGDHHRMVVVRHPARTPVVSSPSYASPVPGRFSVKELSPIVESPKTDSWAGDEKENITHCFSGSFSSVSMFKQYQNAAMAILEKSDYTMIHGNAFIKKSGARFGYFHYHLKKKSNSRAIAFFIF
ncbi:hypothetical protein AXF42_Ash008736 [Apostasia shenzhenica]|uniref:Uncharacterized protein n=1 Tax=Apostasia shenzhenica TaxID=1088818 RepID=A0A2I0B2A4_9ASPA|nr:hypothetical protein AXF42_Ash008736 [Apostasia shenzhenica]